MSYSLFITQGDSVPGLDIAQEASKRTIMGLKQAKANKSESRAPHVVVLSAAPVNPILSTRMPFVVWWLVTSAFSFVYADLPVAEQMYRGEKDLLPVTFVQPPGLTQGPSCSYLLHYGEGVRIAFLSYSDLATAMIDIARRSG